MCLDSQSVGAGGESESRAPGPDRRGAAAVVGTAGRNRELMRYVIAHFLAVIAEWSALIGLLVFTFERAGARATGFASLTALAPYLLLSATTAGLAQSRPPAGVRLAALVVQVVGYGIAGWCVLVDGPVLVAVVATSLAVTGVTAIRPTGAVLLPAWARSSRELTATNVRVGYCESASVLLGPLMATGLLALGGGGAVLVGCAALVAASAAISAFDVRRGPPASKREKQEGEHSPGPRANGGVAGRIRGALGRPFAGVALVARQPGAAGVLAAASGQFVMIGAFDITLVVIASEHDELGKAGAGILTACFGAGAFLSMIVAGRAARRPRLAPLILVLLVLMSVVCLVFGIASGVVAAVLTLPILGASRSVLDLMSRVLLQRSAPPSELADVFGALEAASGLGLLIGSLMAQVLIASWGASAALFGVAGAFALLALALLRPLQTVDDRADVPVVAMSLLRRMPVFAPLPTFALEAVARSAIELPVAAGVEVIRQGDHGDRFYAVADGVFDVVMSGVQVRTVERGGSFGEVALLADVPRTATVTAKRAGHLLAIERDPFLLAVTGYESSHVAARAVVGGMTFESEISLPEMDPPPPTATGNQQP